MGGVSHRVHRANLKWFSSSLKWTTVHHTVYGKREAKGLNVTTKVDFLNVASDALHTNPALLCPTTNKEFLRVCSNLIFLLLFLRKTILPRSDSNWVSLISYYLSVVILSLVCTQETSFTLHVHKSASRGHQKMYFYTLLCVLCFTQTFHPCSGSLYVLEHLFTQSKVHYDGVKMIFATVCSFTPCK